jgi:hypothetical protein
MKKKLLGEISPTTTTFFTTSSVSVTASGPWGDQEKEFIYPTATTSAEVVASLSHELGTRFKPKSRKQIIEVVEVAKSRISDIQAGINLEEGFYLRIKREPQKTIKIFEETEE